MIELLKHASEFLLASTVIGTRSIAGACLGIVLLSGKSRTLFLLLFWRRDAEGERLQHGEVVGKQFRKGKALRPAWVQPRTGSFEGAHSGLKAGLISEETRIVGSSNR